jgi:hypothetical protein
MRRAIPRLLALAAAPAAVSSISDGFPRNVMKKSRERPTIPARRPGFGS